ncbi:aminotransferase class I/II-fold pyridoxal phosphate-dependent enzyme [Cellulomonas sp. DKR-3]|uniref:Aminotransferase class I/II-fold pyridoxal phosphate-dependent enzyme n=1 Tax=Cellulomonas fulva TaxID=2835530 RepID=A0ABS5U0V1_9CELL|nr:aminotransferase class I/II-fold pyridoxal phosphate-dependent enzyme [Cellulomonas fulva]MBT0995000.1 aminotransferase class I/II-fold pyridoxal phosphate-dependent enzyme [Cellulomonas fulva]
MPSPSSTSPVLRVPRSGIRALMELALQDPQAIHLEIGEPDALVPQHVVEAVADAVDRGATGYSSSLGLPELRAAAAARVARRSGVRVDPARVVVTHGAMHGLAMAMATLLGPGDEVLLPDPTFPNWEMAAVACGAVPRTYRTRCEEGFVPLVADVEAAITDRTRALVVCSPNNPTGAVYPAETVAALVELARRHDLWVLSDECYESVTFGVPHTSPAQHDVDGRVLVFHTMSKTYAMTGWRVGYVVLPSDDLLEPFGHLAEATVACPATTSQRAALAALEGPQEWVHESVESYWDRRDAAVALLAGRGVRFVEPDGAFYLMVDVGTPDTEAFARSLLADRHVAVAPGSTFGAAAQGMVRISLAAPRAQLVEGLGRLADHLAAGSGGAGRAAASR